MLVAGERKPDARADQQLEEIAGVVHDVALTTRAGDRQQVMVLHVDLELRGIGELLDQPPVPLAADLPVVEVGLGGVGSDDDDALGLDAPVARADHLLEVDVADVARVVVAGDGHDLRAQLLKVCGGGLVFLPEALRS